MSKVRLQFSTTKDFGSKFIRLMTWSEYSHVDIVLPDGTLLGARMVNGVQIRPADYCNFSRVDIYETIVPVNDTLIYDFARSQVGKPYDWKGIINIGLERNWQEPDSWFCSELAAWCFTQAGTPLLSVGEQYYRVTPRDLTISPLLARVER
jgi:uncharacterized protein YycO